MDIRFLSEKINESVYNAGVLGVAGEVVDRVEEGLDAYSPPFSGVAQGLKFVNEGLTAQPPADDRERRVVEPVIPGYTILRARIQLALLTGDIDSAIKMEDAIIQDMLARASKTRDEGFFVAANRECEAFAKVLIKKGKMDKVQALFDKLINSYPLDKAIVYRGQAIDLAANLLFLVEERGRLTQKDEIYAELLVKEAQYRLGHLRLPEGAKKGSELYRRDLIQCIQLLEEAAEKYRELAVATRNTDQFSDFSVREADARRKIGDALAKNIQKINYKTKEEAYADIADLKRSYATVMRIVASTRDVEGLRKQETWAFNDLLTRFVSCFDQLPQDIKAMLLDMVKNYVNACIPSYEGAMIREAQIIFELWRRSGQATYGDYMKVAENLPRAGVTISGRQYYNAALELAKTPLERADALAGIMELEADSPISHDAQRYADEAYDIYMKEGKKEEAASVLIRFAEILGEKKEYEKQAGFCLGYAKAVSGVAKKRKLYKLAALALVNAGKPYQDVEAVLVSASTVNWIYPPGGGEAAEEFYNTILEVGKLYKRRREYRLAAQVLSWEEPDERRLRLNPDLSAVVHSIKSQRFLSLMSSGEYFEAIKLATEMRDGMYGKLIGRTMPLPAAGLVKYAMVEILKQGVALEKKLEFRKAVGAYYQLLNACVAWKEDLPNVEVIEDIAYRHGLYLVAHTMSVRGSIPPGQIPQDIQYFLDRKNRMTIQVEIEKFARENLTAWASWSVNEQIDFLTIAIRKWENDGGWEGGGERKSLSEYLSGEMRKYAGLKPAGVTAVDKAGETGTFDPRFKDLLEEHSKK